MNRGAVQRGFIWLLLWLLPILATAQPVAPDVLVRATVTDVLQVIRQSSDANGHAAHAFTRCGAGRRLIRVRP
jgi:hypothetical protein